MAAETKKREPSRPPPASERLPTTIYAELRRIAQRMMRGENAGHTLQTTALVHEAFLRLAEKQLSPTQSTHMRAAFAQPTRSRSQRDGRRRLPLERDIEARRQP